MGRPANEIRGYPPEADKSRRRRTSGARDGQAPEKRSARWASTPYMNWRAPANQNGGGRSRVVVAPSVERSRAPTASIDTGACANNGVNTPGGESPGSPCAIARDGVTATLLRSTPFVLPSGRGREV